MKKQSFKKLIQTLVLALGAFLLAFAPLAGTVTAHAADNQSSVSAIKKRGYIKIAVFGDLAGSTRMASAWDMICTWHGGLPRI